jgi:hypothetical protein
MHHVVTPEIPLGCPLVVFKDHEWSPQLPTVSVRDGDTWRDLPLTVLETETKNLDIYMETIDADCNEFHGSVSRPWDRVTLDLGGVQVGDVVTVHGGTGPYPTILPAGPCPTPGLPVSSLLYCQSPVQDYWACHPEDWPQDPADDDQGGGCNAGGGLGIAAAALLAGLRRRRATARRRS